MASEAELQWIGHVVNEVKRLYPSLAWMIDVPGLGDVVMLAAAEQWDEGRIVSAVQGTDWWKERTAAGRAFEELIQTDPGSAEQQVQAIKTQMQQFAASNRLTLSDDQALFLAWDVAKKGQTNQEWQAGLVRFLMGDQGQQAPTVADNLKALAAQYAVPMSDATLNKWSQDVLSGMVDEATFRSYLVEQAKSMFPGLANALDRGITVDQYVAPYREIAVQELGVNPAEIDWRDPKWNMAIHKVDPKTGTPTAMSIADWTKEVRTNPVYGFDQTQRAQEQATMLGQALLQRLGRAG